MMPVVPMLREVRPQRIAVFRALQLGDMLCVVPALRALRAALPQAHVTLIGLPWAAGFVQRFSSYIDEFMLFPGFPGFPEQEPVLQDFAGFVTMAQQRKFDLALQMHGSGQLSNPLTVLFGASRNAGFYLPGQYCPDPAHFLPWQPQEHEVTRYLDLMAALGFPAQGSHLEFPLTEADHHSLHQCTGQLPAAGTYVCIHPGARLPSRRWLPQRFAAIADRLAGKGLQVIVTGSAFEADLTAAVVREMRASAIDLTGKTDLGALAALVAGARMVICNDTGISHIAAATGTPSVVICSGADSQRWAPLDRKRHRLLQHLVACRPCMYVECPINDHPCASNVTIDMVWSEAVQLLESWQCLPRSAALQTEQAQIT